MTAHDLADFMETMVAPCRGIAPAIAESIARDHYQLEAVATPLTGERDENFLLAARDGSAWVLKVASPHEDPAATCMQVEALLHLERADSDLPCPRVRRTRDGAAQVTVTGAHGGPRLARVVSWLPGVPLRQAPRSARQRTACGRLAARLGRALQSFDHPAARRTIAWDLCSVPKLRSLLAQVPELPHADFVSWFIAWFAAEVTPRLAVLPRQFIHNDFNDRNILVDAAEPDSIAGVIDFGDAIHTVRVADVAIAAVAQITGPDTAGTEAGDLATAYHAVLPLARAEQEVLGPLIAARIVTGILIPAWHRRRNPEAAHYDTVDADHVARRVALARRLMLARFDLG